MTATFAHADQKTKEEFTNKLNDQNLLAITHKLTFEVVEFIPMEEFNKRSITAENYQEERREYISEHSTNLREEMQSLNSQLTNKGMYVEVMSQNVQEYSPKGIFEQMIKSLEPKDFLKMLEGLTSPPPQL